MIEPEKNDPNFMTFTLQIAVAPISGSKLNSNHEAYKIEVLAKKRLLWCYKSAKMLESPRTEDIPSANLNLQ